MATPTEADTDRARRLCRQAAAALHAGRLAAAEAAARRAAALDPSAAAQALLGEALSRQGRLAEAVAAREPALALRPPPARVLLAQARDLQRLGAPDRAARCCRAIVALDPVEPATLVATGQVLERCGRPEQALGCFERAAARAPASLPALLGMARAQDRLGRRPAAIAACRRALELEPEHAPALTQLGDLLIEAGELAEAVALLERAVALAPGSAAAHYHLGRACYRTGEHARAVACHRASLAADPDRLANYAGIAKAKRFRRPDDPDLAAMRRHHADPAVTGPARARLCLALGKALEDLGEHDEACARILEMNRIRAAARPPALGAEARFLGIVRAAHRHLGPSPPAEGPARLVFVLGLPRSGKSSVEALLCHDGRAAATGEAMPLVRLRQLYTRLRRDEADDAALARAFAAEFGAVAAGLGRFAAAARGARPVAVSTGFFGFQFAGLLAQAIEGVRFVVCRRPVEDLFLALFRHDFGDSAFSWTTDPEALLDYLRLYREMMEFWRPSLTGRVHEAAWHRIVGAPEREAAALFGACGLTPPDPEGLPRLGFGSAWSDGLAGATSSPDPDAERAIRKAWRRRLPQLARLRAEFAEEI